MTHTHDHDDEIDCTIAIEQFYAYLDNELKNRQDVVLFEQHLEHCKSCFSRLELEKELNKRLRDQRGDDVPADLQARINNLLDEL